MVVPFGLISIGILLAYSGLKGKTILETLKGLPGTVFTTPYESDLRAAAAASSDGDKSDSATKKQKSGSAGIIGDITGAIQGVTGGGGPPTWGGAKKVLEPLTKGFRASSTKRSTKYTASGNISDHWVGAKYSYAKDIPATGSKGDRIANTVATRLGRPEYKGGSWLTVNVGNYRVQVGWKVEGHLDHVHVGARRLDHMGSG